MEKIDCTINQGSSVLDVLKMIDITEMRVNYRKIQ